MDGIFILEKKKRAGDKAKLTIANRDTEGHQFNLSFDRSNCRWQFIGEENEDGDEYGAEQLFDTLSILMDEAPAWKGTSSQLCEDLNLLAPTLKFTPVALSKILKSHQDFMKSQYGIDCKFTRNKEARVIELSRNVAEEAVYAKAQ